MFKMLERNRKDKDKQMTVRIKLEKRKQNIEQEWGNIGH